MQSEAAVGKQSAPRFSETVTLRTPRGRPFGPFAPFGLGVYIVRFGRIARDAYDARLRVHDEI